MDAFQKFPHFIDTDIRINRKFPHGYNVNYLSMKQRHEQLLPSALVKNKSILDLGCCVGATGAWVLDADAISYTGVELQKSFANQAKENLTKSFPNHNWQILETSLENFFRVNTENYDIVYAGGILYHSLYYQELLKNISEIANFAVVIESRTPKIINKLTKEHHASAFLPVVEYDENGMLHESSANLKIKNAVPGVGAVSTLLEDLGFSADLNSYCKITYPELGAGERFGCIFYKKQQPSIPETTENLYYNNNSSKLTDWSATIPTSWEFNDEIAIKFVQHARMHIPDYDKIIDLSVRLCQSLLKDPINNKIIDIGCATGETISRLYASGCCNLVGVDNKEAMLNQCDPQHAYYDLNENFPIDQGPYDAALCNWTLHFIQNKKDYLKQVYQGLNHGGFMILTDKTESSGVALKLYHDFKRSQGVSEEEIKAKAESIKNVMFIDPPKWYFDTLKDIGFTDVSIISSAPCFTTFIAIK